MQASPLPFRRWVGYLGLSFSLLGGTHAGQAQPRSGQPSQPAAAQLRVIVTPLTNSSTLRVRYESPGYDAVRLQISDTHGQVLYTNLVRKWRFAGDFSLAGWPAGDYTIELRTPGDRYTETVRLTERSPVLLTLANSLVKP